MRANLEAMHGLALSEAVAVALAEVLGGSDAHALVAAACRRALAERRPLVQVLCEDPAVRRQLTPEQIACALAPDQYLGAAPAFVARVLERRATGR
jgi:3-carboxy-cis,cis-muconate cycloisomerase